MKRDFLQVTDFNESEVREAIRLAIDLKKKKGQILDVLRGKTVACILHKP
jgi:ornithine carbamoyltransferase